MFAFLAWCLLFVLCWPVALLALIVYPFVWLLLLPFRRQRLFLLRASQSPRLSAHATRVCVEPTQGEQASAYRRVCSASSFQTFAVPGHAYNKKFRLEGYLLFLVEEVVFQRICHTHAQPATVTRTCRWSFAGSNAALPSLRGTPARFRVATVTIRARDI
jgi:hypothetical protein